MVIYFDILFLSSYVMLGNTQYVAIATPVKEMCTKVPITWSREPNLIFAHYLTYCRICTNK